MKKLRRPLLGVFLLALIIRLLPLSIGSIVGLDSYLHRDIALRVLETGSLLSYDPLSLIGMKAYSYPPGFHVLLAGFMLVLSPDLASKVLPALLGASSVVVVFFISQEIFDDKRISLFSAFLIAMAPSHVFRTSLTLPESLGILFFVVSFLCVIRLVKTNDLKYLLIFGGVFLLYLLSHRGWFILGLSVGLFLLVYYAYLLKVRKNIINLAALVVGGYLLASVYLSINDYPNVYLVFKGLFLEMLLRIPRVPVNALGYFKWVGIAQIVLGTVGITLLIKSKDKLKFFLVVWAFFLLGVGSMSFRFRDPYGAIPMSMLASYTFVEYVLPGLQKLKYARYAAISLLVVVSVAQGAYTSLYLVEYPKVGEESALAWLEENSAEDSIVLTWKEEGYYVIGIAKRKDIIIWKRVYQGFFGEAPRVEEAKQSYKDVATMFRTVNKDRSLELMDEYSVDYIFIDRRMRVELSGLEYGLVEYLSYDTYFKPLIANGDAELYRFERESIAPENAAKIAVSDTNSSKEALSMVPHVEEYWNGVAYLSLPNYRANYATNARLAVIYLQLYELTGQEAFKDRSAWLLEWLAFEQLESGGWSDQNFNMPEESVVITCQVTNALIEADGLYPDEPTKAMIERSSSFLYSQIEDGWIKTLPDSTTDVYTTDAICLPVTVKLASLKGEFTAASKDLAGHLVSVQLDDGSWTYGEESVINTVNSQTMVLDGLVRYYTLTGDRDVEQSIKDGVAWLDSKQNGAGQFSDYLIEKTGKTIKPDIASYTRAASIYEASGNGSNKTVDYLLATYEPNSGKRPLEDLVYITEFLTSEISKKG